MTIATEVRPTSSGTDEPLPPTDAGVSERVPDTDTETARDLGKAATIGPEIESEMDPEKWFKDADSRMRALGSRFKKLEHTMADSLPHRRGYELQEKVRKEGEERRAAEAARRAAEASRLSAEYMTPEARLDAWLVRTLAQFDKFDEKMMLALPPEEGDRLRKKVKKEGEERRAAEAARLSADS